MSDGPRVLVLGGLGFIGRHLVKYLVDFKLCSLIRVVDKQLPQMAFLNDAFSATFRAPEVEIMQCDLSLKDHVERCFGDVKFNIVVNLASESQFGHFDSKYERNILTLRTLCAERAARLGSVEKYVEVSTAQVYDGDNKRPSDEQSATKPWTVMAKYHLLAEEAVLSNWSKSLPVVVLRLPVVYGPGDMRGLMPRLACAAVYEHLAQTMEFLWSEDLRVHTVHVQDVAAAIWHLCCSEEVGVFNLVDDSDTTQGTLNALLEQLFAIKTGFHGAFLSNIAQLKLEDLVEEANEGHITPWNEMLRTSGISDSPLSPYLEKELLYNNPLCISAEKIKRAGFQCSCPRVTAALLQNSLDYWTGMNLFPKRVAASRK